MTTRDNYNLPGHAELDFGPALTAAGDTPAVSVDGMSGRIHVQALFDVAGPTNDWAVDGSTDGGVTWHEQAQAVVTTTEDLATIPARPFTHVRGRLTTLDAATSAVTLSGLAQV